MSTSKMTNIEREATRACISCRQRRRWCDRTLPNCLNCTKAGRQCDGYDPDRVRTFVNLDGTNVSRPNKKQLLCEALADSKHLSANEARPPQHNPSINQISTSSSYNVTPQDALNIITVKADFPQHVGVLWQTFLLSYCQTRDYWPPGCSLLALQNEALDLSLVALSAQQLACKLPKSDLRLLSLTAYNNSIRLYRNLVQQQRSGTLTAVLVVTSSVYALIEASLMQPEDIAGFGWGKSGHFDGALALMQETGPYVYSISGFHLVFKKIREMGLFLALSRHGETFLSTEAWMTIPWNSQPKTWRDKLYDLAMGVSELVASSLVHDQVSRRPESIRAGIDKALRIEAEISIWQSSWFKDEYPSLQVRCDCQRLAMFSCICSVPVSKFPTDDFALLQFECWALQLLISNTLRKLLAAEVESTTSWIDPLRMRSSHIASYMEAASTSPAFKNTAEQISGITEGLCRTIFPMWTIREHWKMRDSNS